MVSILTKALLYSSDGACHIENLTQAREAALRGAFRACYDLCGLFQRQTDSVCKHNPSKAEHNEERVQCDILSFGSITKCLEMQSLWPIRGDPSAYKGSYENLLESMKNMKIFIYPHRYAADECERRMEDLKAELVKKAEKALTEALRKVIDDFQPYLKAQSQKCPLQYCAVRGCSYSFTSVNRKV